MNSYPAIALVELSSIASGIYCTDAMVKCAPITVLKSGTVHNGKFLILIGGSVAAVEEAYMKAIILEKDQLIDNIFLPDVHIQVHDAILGKRQPCDSDALGIIEAKTVSCIIKSADAAIKGTDITITEIRVADDIGGKSFALFNGKVEEVETAIQIAREQATREEYWLPHRIISSLHDEVVQQVAFSTKFADVSLQKIEGSEV